MSWLHLVLLHSELVFELSVIDDAVVVYLSVLKDFHIGLGSPNVLSY